MNVHTLPDVTVEFTCRLRLLYEIGYVTLLYTVNVRGYMQFDTHLPLHITFDVPVTLPPLL